MTLYPAPPALFPFLTAPSSPIDMIPTVRDPTGRGSRAWEILSRLTITEGESAGQPIGQNPPPWQPLFTRLVFGHTDQAGRRVLREIFVSIGKKNGKTTFASAIALTKLLLEEEQRDYVVLLAANRPQARISFDTMVSMIRADAELARRFEIVDHRHTIRYPKTSSRATAISADMASLVGFNPALAIVDELHLLGATPKGAKLINQIRTGSVARREPMLLSISTAPTERSEGVFEATMAKAKRVIAGEEIDHRFFAWLCSIPDGLDPTDPENWGWANPSLDYTVTLERLIANRASAESDPAALRAFDSQNLNILPDTSAGEGRWISTGEWDELADDTITLEALIDEAEQVYVGIDAGGLDDLSAVFVLGRAGDTYLGWSHQWLSRRGYEKRRRTNDYDGFIAAGHLTLFDGGAADIDGIAEVVRLAGAQSKLKLIGIDSYGATGLAEALKDCGAEVVSVPQSWRLTPSITWTERKVADGTLRHSGSTALRWNMQNAIVTRHGNAVSISKATVVGPGKIDGLAAMLTAIAALLAAPDGAGGLDSFLASPVFVGGAADDAGPQRHVVTPDWARSR